MNIKSKDLAQLLKLQHGSKWDKMTDKQRSMEVEVEKSMFMHVYADLMSENRPDGSYEKITDVLLDFDPMNTDTQRGMEEALEIDMGMYDDKLETIDCKIRNVKRTSGKGLGSFRADKNKKHLEKLIATRAKILSEQERRNNTDVMFRRALSQRMPVFPAKTPKSAEDLIARYNHTHKYYGSLRKRAEELGVFDALWQPGPMKYPSYEKSDDDDDSYDEEYDHEGTRMQEDEEEDEEENKLFPKDTQYIEDTFEYGPREQGDHIHKCQLVKRELSKLINSFGPHSYRSVSLEDCHKHVHEEFEDLEGVLQRFVDKCWPYVQRSIIRNSYKYGFME